VVSHPDRPQSNHAHLTALQALWSWWLTLHWVVAERYNCMFSSCVQLPALTTTLVTLRGSFAKIKFYWRKKLQNWNSN